MDMSIRSALMTAGVVVLGNWIYDKFVKGRF